ncbi:O-antigen ligase family protein [Methylocapsa palsarum]|uniref:O-Antigen ligase n=1 Tax=Methylocapsa palsarum TaxID=1612308 RepID=A0A1I4A5N0_9HYPH|nr:O-antigen ligase family protein [Methylocapsa palsarum]SFK51658.1 O-Antigen ligase [Methylocapsa palsarum]
MRYGESVARRPPRPAGRRFRPLEIEWLRGATMFDAFLRGIPVLWGLGVLTPAGALMLGKLAYERWPRGALVNLVVYSWIAIGVSAACAAILNGIAIDDFAKGFGNAFGFGVFGWVFGALAIAAGAAHRLDDARTIRAMTMVGGYIIILGAIAAVARAFGMRELELWPTPLGLILPSSPSVSFYTVTSVFQSEETLGEASMRLILFFPWTTGLGLGGLAITFISALERDLRRRFVGVGGGLVAVVFSKSRIAIATLVAVGALLVFLKLPLRWRIVVVGLAIVGFFIASINGFDPIETVKLLRDEINGARAGSSLARELIYEKSWEGFLQSPLIGHGWIGESVHKREVLPIGSHSTIYGLAYTGGAPTLAAFFFALAATLAALAWRLRRLAYGDPRRDRMLVGLGLALCLAIFCRYETLSNLTLPCLFLFTWIGACLADSLERDGPTGDAFGSGKRNARVSMIDRP